MFGIFGEDAGASDPASDDNPGDSQDRGDMGDDTREDNAAGDLINRAFDEEDLQIIAGAGNDTITTGYGDDTISGGEGNDRIEARSGDNLIDGGAGNDHLRADGDAHNSNIIHGGEGNDTNWQP